MRIEDAGQEMLHEGRREGKDVEVSRIHSAAPFSKGMYDRIDQFQYVIKCFLGLGFKSCCHAVAEEYKVRESSQRRLAFLPARLQVKIYYHFLS